MLRLALLCVVLMVSCVALAMQVWASPEQRLAPSTPAPEVPSEQPPPAPTASGAAGQVLATEQSEALSRTAVLAQWQPEDPIGVMLTGTVRWQDGTPVAEPGIYLRQGRASHGASSASDGSYAIIGLQPGEWDVSLRAEGAVDVAETITIGEQAQQEHHFVLDPSFPVRVKIVTANGEDGTRALRMALHNFGDFSVAGQRDRFPDRLAPTDYGVVFVGDAKWNSERNPKDGFAGTLFLAAAPPQHVALLQRHLVIEQQVVQPGQKEVAFTVDLDALKKLAGSATVRVLDADSGQPLAKARVSLNTSNRMGPGQVTDDEGRAVVAGLSPGLLRCQISAADHEQYYSTVRVATGEQLDLGDVRLGSLAPLAGTVLDAEGKPAGASLSWTELKWHLTGTEFAGNRTARTEADGSFSLWGTGRGRIAVTARGPNGELAAGVFDNPSTTPIVLQLAEAGECVVTGPKDPTRTFTVTLFDEGKFAVAATTLESRQTKAKLSLPYGSYGFEVHDQDARLVKAGSLTFTSTPCSLEIQ